MSSPDLIVHNGVVRTMDPGHPHASAFAVTEGVITAVGDDELLQLAGAATEVLDLQGAPCLPGLLDAHNHHNLAGEAELYHVQISPTASVREICEAVESWCSTLEAGSWVIGGIWGSNLHPELSSPEALAQLDAASGDHPVLLSDDSRHNKWANTLAMRIGGIFDLTEDPPGGHVVRDSYGEPTGLLLESAGALVEKQRKAAEGTPGPGYMANSSERAIQMLHELGITGFQDAAASLEILQGLKKLDEEGRLKAWAVSSLLINDFIFGTEVTGEALLSKREEYRTVRHRPDFAKIFLDGIPPSRTAAFLEPYLPDEVHGHAFCGQTTMPPEELEGWMRVCAREGLGVKIHCTGDASINLVLNTTEKLRAEGYEDFIVHATHGQYVHPGDIPRFEPLGVVAEISPALWFPQVIVEALRAVLPEPQASRIHPNRSLLEAGAVLAGGSDWPVAESPNPWHAIYGLITRKDPTGRFPGELWPEQAITREEALAVYTTGAARAMGLSTTAGQLSPGFSADFVIPDRDPLTCEDEEVKDITVDQTWFAGEPVHQR